MAPLSYDIIHINIGYGVKMPGGRPRQIFYNLDYFNEIDSSEKAYWLGFIFGDGTISNKKYNQNLKIHLAEKDLFHIKKFAKDIDYHEKIEKSKIVLSSQKIVQDLINKGIKENKTYLGGSPKNVPEKFFIDCARGIFDADGSISYHENSKIKLQAKLTTGKDLIEWFKEATGLGNTIIPVKNKNHYEMRITANVENFTKLYGGSSRFLERKYNLVKPHILI